MSTPGFTLNHEVVETPPRPSATVLMLRDGDAGLEILMQRRSDESDVLGGAYVFPGGKIDREDGDDDMLERIDRSAAELQSALGDPALDARAAAACFVAAARETFEEAGVLLAVSAGGAPADAALAAEATRLSREGFAFIEVLEHLDLHLTVGALTPWSRWVTPRMPSLARKRFDSRFFLARVPHDQVARHDDREATDSVWLAPRRALERFAERKIMLAAPQLMSLFELSAHPNVDAAIGSAALRWPRRIDPMPFEHDGTRAVAYPGDPRHAEQRPVMPGPTRLVFRDGRFEPVGGVQELFSRA
ncbi:MAG: NUDIX hydrolase [Burkholderiales bacterium]|nr:NUDIX hydrolase [Burkholderiales bacterium]